MIKKTLLVTGFSLLSATSLSFAEDAAKKATPTAEQQEAMQKMIAQMQSQQKAAPKMSLEEAKEYFIENNEETHIHFPVKKYPEKLKTLNLDKTPAYEGVLKGIKGQYLIFEDDTVFNVRSWEGYVIRLEIL